VSPFSGFTRNTPVPNLFFGPLLREIDDLEEMKCLLRAIFLLYQRRGFPQAVGESELVSDIVAETGLSVEATRRGLHKAVARGVLLCVKGQEEQSQYLLHTQANREYLERHGLPPVEPEEAPQAGPPQEPSSIFALYEENIGVLTPMVAEELKAAEATYPWEWIQEAFKEAVMRNRRHWRYIARILERWSTEGKGHGESTRYPEKITASEYIRRHGLPP